MRKSVWVTKSQNLLLPEANLKKSFTYFLSTSAFIAINRRLHINVPFELIGRANLDTVGSKTVTIYRQLDGLSLLNS